jgi:hypothetical protein
MRAVGRTSIAMSNRNTYFASENHYLLAEFMPFDLLMCLSEVPSSVPSMTPVTILNTSPRSTTTSHDRMLSTKINNSEAQVGIKTVSTFQFRSIVFSKILTHQNPLFTNKAVSLAQLGERQTEVRSLHLEVSCSIHEGDNVPGFCSGLFERFCCRVGTWRKYALLCTGQRYLAYLGLALYKMRSRLLRGIIQVAADLVCFFSVKGGYTIWNVSWESA